jgi:hypothetical protein
MVELRDECLAYPSGVDHFKMFLHRLRFGSGSRVSSDASHRLLVNKCAYQTLAMYVDRAGVNAQVYMCANVRTCRAMDKTAENFLVWQPFLRDPSLHYQAHIHRPSSIIVSVDMVQEVGHAWEEARTCCAFRVNAAQPPRPCSSTNARIVNDLTPHSEMGTRKCSHQLPIDRHDVLAHLFPLRLCGH